MTNLRCSLLAAVGEVRAHEHEPGQLSLRPRGGLERDCVQAADLGEDLLQAPHELERALRPVLLLKRMEVAEARERDHALVDPRVVLHRAGAERVEAGVHAEGPVGQSSEMADDLRLGELGKARRLAAAELLGHLGRWEVVARERAGRRPACDFSKISFTPASTSARRSMSPGRALLGHADEQRVLHSGVVALERVARMDALLPRGADCLLGGTSDAHGKLLERCPVRKHAVEARVDPSHAPRGSCRSPPARAVPAGPATRGAPARRGRGASGWS